MEKHPNIEQLSATKWKIESYTTQGKWYMVNVTEAGIKCECEYHQKRNALCKHAKVVESLITKKLTPDEISETRIDKPDMCCPKCKSPKFVKNGHRRRKKRGDAQRYKCSICNYRFTGDIGFTGRHYPPRIIALALQLLATGSLSNTSLSIQQDHSFIIHPSTIHRWAAKYTDKIEKYLNTLPINTSAKWSTDEKSLRGVKHWLFAVIDTGTKFVLSWDMTHMQKMSYNPTNLFTESLKRAGHRPAILVSDKLHQFASGFNKVFYTRRNPKTLHFRESHIKSKYSNNNAHERFNGTIQDFIASKRGFKTKKPPCIKLFLIHYNFIRPHMGLDNLTPAQAAGITINGDNTWLTLIQNAALAAQ